MRLSLTEGQRKYAADLQQHLDDADQWEKAAKAVKDLIMGGRHADILEKQSVAAYIKKDLRVTYKTGGLRALLHPSVKRKIVLCLRGTRSG